MAFYRDTQGRTRQEKRKIAENRGGFEDEGSRYRTRGDKPQGERPYGGRPSGERPGSDRPRGGKPYGEGRPQGERRPYGESRPYGEGRPQGERPYGGRPSGDRPRGGKPYGEGRPQGERRPYGESRPYGEGRPQGERPYGGRPGGDRPRGGKPYGESRPQGERRPYGESRPYGENRPQGERPYGGRPGSDRPRGGKPYGESRPQGERPYGNRPSGDRPRFDRAPSGDMRIKRTPEKYSERGGSSAPRPYDEAHRYERFRYAPPTPASYAPIGAELPEEDALVPNENMLCGRNPIREALKSGRDIEKLLVQRGELSGSARELVQMAKERRIPVQEVDKARLDALAQSHQGMLAFASAYNYGTVEDMLALAKERGEAPFLVILDGVTDPHNLGAIIRTAECAGAHGVIVPERRAVGLTPAAVKASAGAVEYVPVARVTNLVATIEELQAQNIWIYAADMKGEDYAKVDFGGGVALVVGAEGEGVSRLVLEKCDKTVALPVKGKLDSLNASVAAGVLLYAIMRAR